MLSQRRIRLLAIALLLFIIITLYYSSEGRMDQNQKFYRSTVKAMEAHNEAKEQSKHAPQGSQHEGPGSQKAEFEDDVMRPATPKNNDGREETEDISIAGRTKITVPKNRNGPQKENEEVLAPSADEHAQAKTELNGILKRSPIIIFSKSYCPHSARAKSILLEKYSIVPAPFVVELDQHELGRELQTVLGETTGRRTVPNVLVSGKSIGGGDDIAALAENNELATKLQSLGGKWVQEVRRN